MIFTCLPESILNLVFVPFTSNVTNQSSDVEFTLYVFRLCIGDCVLAMCLFEGNIFAKWLHFFAGVADLVVCGAVASKVCV